MTVIAQYLHDVGHESLTGTRANPSAHDTVVAENFWKSLTFNQAGDEVSPKFTSIAAIRTAITNANK
ncbi:hypothetical protein [Metalysinibacillus jejuensis]|uniref:hypothetical protein n=1 Tax=Metalysinibacillus jejuensis TaxID=914327 RepID=UPI000D377DEE|nr:hypothetical protein [Metalysinibacillus jejuensis]